MSDTNLVRGGGIGAVLAGVVYLIFSVSSLQVAGGLGSFLSGLSGAFGIVMLFVVLLGQVVGIASLHVLQKERYGRLGSTGALVSVFGFAMQLVGFVGLALLESSVFFFLVTIGVLVPFVGLVLLGIATIRARVLPSWFGVLLIAGFPVVAVLAVVTGGSLGATLVAVALAIFWGLVGYMLLSKGGAQSQRPARVR